jgi:hypothetical protein
MNQPIRETVQFNAATGEPFMRHDILTPDTYWYVDTKWPRDEGELKTAREICVKVLRAKMERDGISLEDLKHQPLPAAPVLGRYIDLNGEEC